MSFKELVEKRYSCRNFDGSKISNDVVLEIIETALKTPSARNSQPWRVYVSNTEIENQKIRECLQGDGKNKFLDNATCFLVIYENNYDKNQSDLVGFNRFSGIDIGEFTAYLTLYAKEKGIDSCIIGWLDNEKLNEVTKINSLCRIVVALGKTKDEETPKKRRLSLDEVVLNIDKF